MYSNLKYDHQLKCLTVFGDSRLAVGGFGASDFGYPTCRIGQANEYEQLNNVGLSDGILSIFNISNIIGIPKLSSVTKIKLKVHPNPSNGVFEIDIPFDGIQHNSLNVLNNLGQIVFSKAILRDKNLKLDLSEFENGVYFLQYINSEGQLLGSEKIILVK